MKSLFTKVHFRTKSVKLSKLRSIGSIFIVALTVLAFSAVSPLKASAGQATLAWDPSTSSDVIGYKIYFGETKGSYSDNLDVGKTTNYTVSSLVDGKTYYFAAVAYNSSGKQSAYSNEVSKTISSTAPVATYTLSASAGTGGSISPSGSVSVTSGASKTFTITPSTGYRISNVTVDGSSVGAVSTFSFSNVTANHTIAATFTANTTSTTNASSYTISASAGTGGSISPSGDTTVSAGRRKTFTMTAASGYKIADVKVDGASVGAVSSYTFRNVAANHTINASFASTSTSSTGSTGSTGSTTTTSSASTIWPSTAVPAVADCGPDGAVELGVKFSSDVNGYITGIRFYKGAGNTGTHVANLWSSTGSRLASATFTSESASGWQQVNFSTPVAITANTTYVASYHTNVGHYSHDYNYFSGQGRDNAPLHVPADGGVYAYGSGSVFPTQSYQSSNYWVDVVFKK